MSFDRRIKIYSISYTQGANGEQVPSLAANPVETWAEKVYKRGGEQQEAGIRAGLTVETFRIRFRTINFTNKIYWDAKYWDIKSIQEDGRRKYIILECENKDSE